MWYSIEIIHTHIHDNFVHVYNMKIPMHVFTILLHIGQKIG